LCQYYLENNVVVI